MKHHNRRVVVIGGGITGITAADELTRMGFGVSLVEKAPFLGGHAAQLSCKATDTCVKCGACVLEEKLARVRRQEKVTLYTGTEITHVSGKEPYQVGYRVHSPLVNGDRCNGCGECVQKCPAPGAILQGSAPRVGPYVAIHKALCRHFDRSGCTLCRDICPQGAITLSDRVQVGEMDGDAILIATGFVPYNPNDKPYGYGKFGNVITSLDAERIIGTHGILRRPTDGRSARRIAFIQCVGSRDRRAGHNWCSKICCGASLRMARLVQSRQNGTHITFFYIDVQTFGKDFRSFYSQVEENVEMIRAIPGDIMETEQAHLNVFYFDPETRSAGEAQFDTVVLSVGLMPCGQNRAMSRLLDWPMASTDFMCSHENAPESSPTGVFTAGATLGPMGIAACVGSAEKTAFDIMRYFGSG